MKREIKFKAKRIDNKEYVEGNYFQTPLTEENSGLDARKGWFFLADGIKRDCIEQNGVAFVIDPETLEVIEEFNYKSMFTEGFKIDIKPFPGIEKGCGLLLVHPEDINTANKPLCEGEKIKSSSIDD